MTQIDINYFKKKAIAFYGKEGYDFYRRVAEKYITDQGIQIPSDGIERMPSYWATIEELIKQDSAK